jgi:hypothetical protein
MEDAGVPAETIDKTMPETLQNFTHYIAKVGRPAAELEYKKDMEQVKNFGTAEGYRRVGEMSAQQKEEIKMEHAHAKRTMRRVMRDAGLPQDEIEAHLPAATQLFVAQLAQGRSAADAEKLLTPCLRTEEIKRTTKEIEQVRDKKHAAEPAISAEALKRAVDAVLESDPDIQRLVKQNGASLICPDMKLMADVAEHFKRGLMEKLRLDDLSSLLNEEHQKIINKEFKEFGDRVSETVADFVTCPANAEVLDHIQFCSNLREQCSIFQKNPDLSGALHVLSLLDKLDAAAPARQQNAPESETGWRHASVDDYGRAMREALEELAESDRAKVKRSRVAYDVAMQKTLAYLNETFGDERRQLTLDGLEAQIFAFTLSTRRGELLPDPELP